MGRRADVRTGKRRAIRDALARLGIHASPAQVMRDLANRGTDVSEDLVRAVRLELQKDGAGLAWQQAARRQGRQRGAVHLPQKRPPRRG